MVKFSDIPVPVKRPHFQYRHCPETAVVSIRHDGITFNWCAEHAADPTCGVHNV